MNDEKRGLITLQRDCPMLCCPWRHRGLRSAAMAAAAPLTVSSGKHHLVVSSCRKRVSPRISRFGLMVDFVDTFEDVMDVLSVLISASLCHGRDTQRSARTHATYLPAKMFQKSGIFPHAPCQSSKNQVYHPVSFISPIESVHIREQRSVCHGLDTQRSARTHATSLPKILKRYSDNLLIVTAHL